MNQGDYSGNGGTALIDLIKGKEVLVVGMARSGIAAAELLAATGAAKITVTDTKEAVEMGEALARLKRIATIELVTGTNSPDLVRPELSLIIKSPGVPPNLELFNKAEQLGIPVIAEIELAYAFLRVPLVGVTGTNGKTTTTSLIAAILKEARFDPVIAAGNIGNPLSGLVGKISAQGMIVAELSSFQLENIRNFRPFVAVFLNFAEDHIDYHGSLDQYFRAKARIVENQVESDYAVLNFNDPYAASLEKNCKSQVIWFGRGPVSVGFGVDNGWVTLYNRNIPPQKICAVAEIALPGEHNLENCLAAGAAAWAAGADPHSIKTALSNFQAIEHRLEQVRNLNGVDYINDSKGTNPGATVRALLSYPGREKILIAGGKNKNADFSGLAEVIKQEVRQVLLLGETKEKLAISLKIIGFENFKYVSSLEEAVELAASEAKEGDIVLLSPACASWDMFTDYEERGNKFKNMVNKLNEKENKYGVTNHGYQ
jgi:UDP-N-acetylmuramoylalanine--D-glutamate ligase